MRVWISPGTVVGVTPDVEEPTNEREQVLQRLKKRRDFYSHLAAFLAVNVAVWAAWALTGRGGLWPAWITGLWAIGLVLNAFDVYLRRPITEADVERELRRLHPQR